MTDGGRNVKKTAEQSEREGVRSEQKKRRGSEEMSSSLRALLTSHF
jgi:hypothetical protein